MTPPRARAGRPAAAGPRTGRARSTPRPTKPADLHRRWLALVETDGPFLAIPALVRVWPQGIPPLPSSVKEALADAKPSFDQAWDAWQANRRAEGAVAAYRPARDAWVETVARQVLRWGSHWSPGDALAAATQVRSPDHLVSLQATGVVRQGDRVGALVLVVDPVDSLHDLGDDGWAASPIDRMELLLRQAQVPIGVVTDGRWWALVSAADRTLAASGVVDSATWVEEPEVRDAFAELVCVRSLLGGREQDRLPRLFAESVLAAEEVTEALGVQVRRAVELVVAALSESGRRAVAAGEPDPLPVDGDEVYQAVVTTLMRVVFLLFAQERGLLPQGELFEQGYGLATVLDELADRARLEGEESLDATHLVWHRLLATSRALYTGASFEDLRLPAYGGSLFDPDRFAFLTATTLRGTLAATVSDRVMLKVLEAVQVARAKGQDARRISFRDIDVEQIGYIYEGLLGYTCCRADEVIVGLLGSDGAEPEIGLAVLDDLFDEHGTDARTAPAVLAWVKEHQPAAKAPSPAALTKAFAAGDTAQDADRVLLAVTQDAALRERLRPYLGAIRRDLRGLPVVIEAGGLVVVETPSRRNAGAHYTPRALAEEVVRHALEPLVYSPGPHQSADPQRWRLLSSAEILQLKVADIACGSGAFLVAAARYLAARLVEAWRQQGETGEPRALQLRATREVVAQCLYGADINAMAVEMCKLSLWLVSLDPALPFSFVDDKILHGNSLLGLTSLDQLRALHIDPQHDIGGQLRFDIAGGELVERLDLDHQLRRAVGLRQSLANEIDELDPQRNARAKRAQLAQLREATADLRLVADGVIAAGLTQGGKPGKAFDARYEQLREAVGVAFPPDPAAADRGPLQALVADGLTPTVKTDYSRWQPLHWCLDVPDVMGSSLHGGFDAIVGNPPFLGGKKISGAAGSDLREWLVNVLADGAKGNADLVAYFFLRARSLLNPRGTLGLIATNTIAQGDTREVGLDRLVAAGFTITRSIQSRSWPATSANLEYAAVWGSVGRVGTVPRVSDDAEVARISTLLEPAGRVDGHPIRLAENAGIAFIGCYVLGMGFVIDPAEAQQWIAADPRNAEVLFPYLNGEDLNSRPDCSASRWVIDFGEREPVEAKTYTHPWTRVSKAVLPERAKADPVKYPRMVHEWWKFWNSRPALHRAIGDLSHVIVIARVSRAVMPARVSAGSVASEQCVVFASDASAALALLSSSCHQLWVIAYGSTLGTGVRYTPSDVFETFPRPAPTEALDRIGRVLDEDRREIMLRRHLGLTKLYNLVHDPDLPDAADADVARMRAIHTELDHVVMAAYGWDDLPLDHGFHSYRQMTRWTVSPAARVEILDRLLEENHRRAALQGAPPPDPEIADDTDGTDDT